MTDDDHLSAENLAGYLDTRLPPAMAAVVEAHLAACEACRSDLVATRRAQGPDRSVRLGVIIPVVGLAAALLLVVPAVLERTGARSSPDQERGPPRSAIPLGIHAPAEDAAEGRDAIRFIWNSAGARAQYRLTVADSTGGIVWSAESADTLLIPGPETGLRAGAAYFWFVDALIPDGRTRTTGTHRFTIPP